VQILPSGGQPTQSGPEQTKLELVPFRGVRYARDRGIRLAEVTSPPYDVIARDIEDQLIAADPHNIVRLILPYHAPGRHGDAWQDAAAALRRWQDEKILVPEQEPALYVYEQADAGQLDGHGAGAAVLQRGLIGALRLVPPDAGVVLPHEDVFPGPVADRLALMEATRANLEPIFLLFDGGRAADPEGTAAAPGRGAAGRLVEETALGAEPTAEAVTDDGVRHRLWTVTDPAALAAVAADLAPRTAVIADGHHRYAAYRELQARCRADGDGAGPWDFGLCLLVDAAVYRPQVGAIHRVISGLAPAAAAELAKSAATVRVLDGDPAALPEAMAELGAASRDGAAPAFLVAGGGEMYLLSDVDEMQVEAAMPERSARWRRLAASVLQELLMARIWGVRDDDASVRIVHNDAAAAIRAADEPPADGTAVICPPMRAADAFALAHRGERVPRKSTSFGPKPRTGLVIRTFAQG
jgi:uncharacterized protein (DUF1015 family)